MQPTIDKDAIKLTAHGQWREVLHDTCGVPWEILDGKHHPCPKCQGKDRFRMIDADAGAVFCNQCFNRKNGDGLAAVMWLRDCDFGEALRIVADHLGIAPSANGKGNPIGIIELVCREKRMPIEAFKQFGAKPATRGKMKVARVPVYNAKGESHSYFDLTANNGKGWFKKGKGTSGMFFPGRLPKAGEIWLIVEGVKDAAAMVGLGFNAAGLPTRQMAVKYTRLFRQVHVVIIPDRDRNGERGAQTTAARLKSIAASVCLATLPAEFTDKDGADVRAVLAMANGEEQLRQAIEDAIEWSAEPPPAENVASDIPRIVVSIDERRVVDEAVAVLADVDRVYQRGGHLVHIVTNAKPPRGVDRPEDAPRIVRIEEPTLREYLAAAAWLEPTGKNDEMKRIHPPQWVVKAVAARGEWPDVRPIEAIVESPILRPDGTVLQTPGYDPSSGVMLRPAMDFPRIEEAPSSVDIESAVDALREVFCDFPFKSEAHRAAAIAGLLTPFARMAFDGPAPMWLIDSNTRGAGKGKLVNAMTLPFLGREVARMTAPGSDEESRKRITSIALAGEPIVLVDNVVTTLGGPSLDAALTTTTWNDRWLGRTEMTGAIPLFVIWFATGNNIVLKADTARRCLHVRLESPHENPEERQDFQHSDLEGWIRSQRGRLVKAALTILRGYFAAGQPQTNLPAWGSFEGWSNLVRQAVVWAGLPDPGATRQELATTADTEAALLRALIAGWEEIDPNGHGIAVAEALKKLDDDTTGEAYPTLRAAVAEMTDYRGKPTARSLGMKLHHNRNRIVGGKYFHRNDAHRGGAVWKIERAEVGDVVHDYHH